MSVLVSSLNERGEMIRTERSPRCSNPVAVSRPTSQLSPRSTTAIRYQLVLHLAIRGLHRQREACHHTSR